MGRIKNHSLAPWIAIAVIVGVLLPAGAIAAAGAAPRASTVVVSSGTITIPGTWTLNLDNGKLVGTENGSDIFWDQTGSTSRQIVVYKGAGLHNLGRVKFSKYGPKLLATLSYSHQPLVGDAGKSNNLRDGDVFAVHTGTHHYAKVRVISYGYDIKVAWITYS